MEDNRENKKLIALFVGFEKIDEEGYINSLQYNGGVEVYKKATGHYDDMLFSTSWDWLITAWHIFITMIWDEGGYDDEDVVKIRKEFQTRIDRDAPGEASVILVNAIKWYNEKK